MLIIRKIYEDKIPMPRSSIQIYKEKFDYTKVEIRYRKSKKERQQNGQI